MRDPKVANRGRARRTDGRHSPALAAVLLALCLTASAAGRQAQETTSWMLAKIEAPGLSRYSLDLVITESGLKVGQRVSLNDLSAAAERLRAGGLFTKANVRYRYADDQLEVTFQTEEAAWDLPVIFDNFVWFADEDLVRVLAKEVPTFDGKAPKSGGVIGRIRQALARLLGERGIAGEVVYNPSYELSGADKEHIFSVKGVNLSVCSLQFPNASGIPEADLQKKSKPLLNNLYSKAFVLEFVKSNLLPMYRERGHLRAQFGGVEVRQEAATACKGGVAVALPFVEGAAYRLGRVEWVGNSSLAAEELNSVLAMRSGEVANGLKFDAGLTALRSTYGKKGYIRARLTPAPAFDEGSRQVNYLVSVNEGSQYRMKDLIVLGLPDKEAERVRKKWKLKAGDVFDALYVNEFLQAGLDARLAGRVSDARLNTDNQNFTVDVTITIK